MYASRTVLCKTQNYVDELLNEEIYKLKPEDIMSINITPYINPDVTGGFPVVICFYVSYVYRWELSRY